MQTGSGPSRVVAGRYRLDSHLGSGGMGTVWQGWDERLRRKVAVKEVTIPDGMPAAEADRLRERYLREARAAARLRHPAVVGVYDVIQEGGLVWIVMELVNARDLAAVLRQDGPVEPTRVARIGLQLLDALDAAHEAGVLHRDVKPANVLIGPDDRTVLTDFGVASVTGDASLTRTGQLVGSPAYLAPERLTGGTVGPASDLWSLGCTLYAAVEGRPPFWRPEQFAIVAAITLEPVPPARNAGLLEPVLFGLLEKDQGERWSSDRTRAALEQVAAGQTVTLTAQWGAPADASATEPAPSTGSGGAGPAGGGGRAGVGTVQAPGRPGKSGTGPSAGWGDSPAAAPEDAASGGDGGTRVGPGPHPATGAAGAGRPPPGLTADRTTADGTAAPADRAGASARTAAAFVLPAAPTPRRRGRRVVLSTVVLLLVIGLGAAAAVVVRMRYDDQRRASTAPSTSPSSPPTTRATLQEFKHPYLGYRILHPSDWSYRCLDDRVTCRFNTLSGSDRTKPDKINSTNNVYVIVQPAGGKTALELAKAEDGRWAGRSDFKDYTTLALGPASMGMHQNGSLLEFTYTNRLTGPRHVLVFRVVVNDRSYEVSLNCPASTFEDDRDVFDQVVDSLVITGPSATP